MAGHNKIRMNDLLTLFRESGFNDAETFIQSGNVVFTSSEIISEDALTEKIESAIKSKFEYDIAVSLRTKEDLKRIISINPFLTEKNFDPSKAAVIFLRDEPEKTALDIMKDVNYPPDRFEITGKEIFIYCPDGFGRTKLYTNFFENKMKVKGTARNWNTIKTILEISERERLL